MWLAELRYCDGWKVQDDLKNVCNSFFEGSWLNIREISLLYPKLFHNSVKASQKSPYSNHPEGSDISHGQNKTKIMDSNSKIVSEENIKKCYEASNFK